MQPKLNLLSFLFSLLLISTFQTRAQKIELLTTHEKTSFRGLSAVNDEVVWVSGNNGQVGRSTDGGQHWTWFTVPGFEKRDFRDIEAFDVNTAVIMAVAEPANILKTTDGGKTWKTVFTDTTKGMFLDAMDFRGSSGVVIGDPVNGKIFLAFTGDRGDTWKVSNVLNSISPAEGEAFFASSGTNITLLPSTIIPVFVSGGKKSLIYNSTSASMELPLVQGGESTGANSLALAPAGEPAGFIVGGDFKRDTVASGNAALFKLYPLTFRLPETPPHGYRSSVCYLSKKSLICCGTSGIDISTDGGMHWKLISRESYHVCQKAKTGKTVFLAGGNGRIARYRR
jgi:hypothetical protein